MAVPTLDQIVDLPLPHDVRLSPSGQHVAYTLRQSDRSSIWVDGRRFTTSSASEDQPRWSPGDSHLLFRSNRTGMWQVYRIPLGGGEAEQLTSEPDGILIFALAPDGSRLAYVALEHPPIADPIHIGVDDPLKPGNDEPGRRLRERNMADGSLQTLAAGPGWIGAIAWSPDSEALAFVRRGWPSLEGGVIPATIETAAGRVLGELKGGPDDLTWIRAGIFYQGTVNFIPRSSQCLYRMEDNSRLVGGDHDCLGGGTGSGAGICGHGPDDLAVLVAGGLGTRLLRIDPETGTQTELLAPMDADISSASVVGDHWAAVVSSGNQLPEVYVDGEQISAHHASDLTWPEQQDFEWTSADGLALDGVVLLPPAETGATAPYPTVFMIHGGPYGSRATRGFQHPMGSWTNWSIALACAGIAAVVPNFRGGLGRGEAFAQSGGDMHQQWADVQACADAAVERSIADPDRLGIGGFSYGGYMGGWAVGHTDRYRAALLGAAPSMHEVSAMASDLMVYVRAHGSAPWDGPAPLPHHEFNTMALIPRVNTPVLVMHGEADVRVPPIHASGYYRGIRDLGKIGELVIYRGAPHTFVTRNHRFDAASRIVEWFGRWL